MVTVFGVMSSIHARSSECFCLVPLPIHSAVATKQELMESDRFGGVEKLLEGPSPGSAPFWSRILENGEFQRQRSGIFDSADSARPESKIL